MLIHQSMMPCPVGVKNRCIVSPILFTLFHNDLKDETAVGSHGIDIETVKLFVLLFADDLVIFAETVIELQRLINRLIEYCDRWHVNVNINKTMVIVLEMATLFESMNSGDSKIQIYILLHIINI